MDFYSQEIKSTIGEKIQMKDFKGKLVLIVNTATQCGLSPQFESLEDLHLAYKENGLVVIGTPCNQFANQEPLSNEEMAEGCRINHGVTFQLTEKIDVNGDNVHPLYRFLKGELGGILGNRIKWNFTKFLIDQKGIPFKRYAPITKPEKIEIDIKNLLQ